MTMEYGSSPVEQGRLRITSARPPPRLGRRSKASLARVVNDSG